MIFSMQRYAMVFHSSAQERQQAEANAEGKNGGVTE